MKTFFLHGLDSSSKETRGQWFVKHFLEISVSALHIGNCLSEHPSGTS